MVLNRAWTRVLFASALLSTAVAAKATLLYDNGPMVTNTGVASGGADASLVQDDSLGLAVAGITANKAGGFWVSDDFDVAAGQTWDINQMTFFGYQKGSTTASTMTGLYVKIYANPTSSTDPTTGTLVFGDDSTNRLSSTSFTNIYRMGETEGFANNSRPMMALNANVSTSLGEGHYAVVWAATGSLGSGPSMTLVTFLGQSGKAGANGSAYDLSFHGGWYDVVDGSDGNGDPVAQDFAFQISGTVPEPSSILVLAGGLIVALSRKRR